MKHLKLWTSIDPATGTTNNYMGSDMSDYYVVASSSDYADLVQQANFKWFEENNKTKFSGLIEFHHMNHWAHGYEIALIHKDSPVGILDYIDDTLGALEYYPIIDDNFYSLFIEDMKQRDWENCDRAAFIDWLKDQYEEPLHELIDHIPQGLVDSIYYDLASKLKCYPVYEDGHQLYFDTEILDAEKLDKARVEGAIENAQAELLASLTIDKPEVGNPEHIKAAQEYKRISALL